MKTDLHELLDRPLPGEPVPDVDRYLMRSRRALRRRRWVATALSAGGAAVVASLVLTTGVTGLGADGPAAQSSPRFAGSPAADRQTTVQPSVRARHPYAALIVDCLSARGYRPTLGTDGGIGHQGTATSIDDFQAAFGNCSALTSDDWRSVYDQEKATADCLRGFQEDVPQIPPFSTFVDRYPDENRWNSYQFVTARPGDDRWDLLNTQCPQPTLG